LFLITHNVKEELLTLGGLAQSVATIDTQPSEKRAVRWASGDRRLSHLRACLARLLDREECREALSNTAGAAGPCASNLAAPHRDR
jgi:hypothetical protein